MLVSGGGQLKYSQDARHHTSLRCQPSDKDLVIIITMPAIGHDNLPGFCYYKFGIRLHDYYISSSQSATACVALSDDSANGGRGGGVSVSESGSTASPSPAAASALICNAWVDNI